MTKEEKARYGNRNSWGKYLNECWMGKSSAWSVGITSPSGPTLEMTSRFATVRNSKSFAASVDINPQVRKEKRNGRLF